MNEMANILKAFLRGVKLLQKATIGSGDGLVLSKWVWQGIA